MDWKKLINLLNVKNWVETFLLKTIISKGVKHLTTFLAGMIGSVYFTDKILPIIHMLNPEIVIDPTKLAIAVGGSAAALSGWLLNWAIKVLDKDGDGYIG